MKNMKIKKSKEEEIKVISHISILKKWEKEFEEILKQKQEKCLKLFPVYKEWFDNYKNVVLSDNISIDKKIENYYRSPPLDNSIILHNMKSIKPDSNFVLLNKESMDSFSRYMMKKKKFNIEIIARFLKGKMISKIGNNLYYVCFIDIKDDIKEGILIFDELDISLISSIINEFLSLDVNIFLNKYFRDKPNSNEKFDIYHRHDFDFLIKKNDTNSFNKKYNLKKIAIPKNINLNDMENTFKSNLQNSSSKINMKDINYIPNNSFKPNGSLNGSKFSNQENKYFNLKSSNVNRFSNFENNNIGNEINPNIRSNLVDCIHELYYSDEILKQFVKNEKGNFKIFQMINRNWLENFKNEIHYEQLKNILKDEESIKLKKLISDFIINNNLNNIQIKTIPKIQREDIFGKYYYYNNYQLLSKKCFSQLCKTFKCDFQNIKEFKTYLLNDKNLFIEYSHNYGEIIIYDNEIIEHIYLIKSDDHISDIINSLQNDGLEDSLKKHGVNILNISNEKKLFLSNKSGKIGEIIFLNNKNNNNDFISFDEDVIKNDENVFDNTQSGKKSRNINNNNDINIPKITKKRRILHKSNITNSSNIKENESNKYFKTPIIKSKMSSKFDSNNKNNNSNYLEANYNYLHKYDDYNNLNQTMKNLRNSQINNNNIITEPNKDSIKLINSKSFISKNSKYKSNKIVNKNKSVFPKLDFNINKLSNKISESSQPINFKNKSKSTKKYNEVKYTYPSQKIYKSKKIFHSSKKLKGNKSPNYSKELNTNSKLMKQYDINPQIKNNKNFLSPQTSKKRHIIKPLIIIPEEQKSPENYDISQNTPGLTGLQNIGATCYMNATLQCFSNVQRFREGILRLKTKVSLNKDLSYSLKEVFVNLWKNNKIKYYEPYNFKNLISEMNPLFKGVAANDSKDLILFILETIHRELNTKKTSFPEQNNANNLNFMEVFNQFTNFYESNNRSIVSDEFYGYFVSIMKCGYCNSVTYNVQIMNILFFPLEKVRIYTKNPYNFVTLEDCFQNYEEPELFTGSDQIFCNLCNMTTNAYNQNKLIIAPKTLIINLNRGKGLEFKVGIKFGEYLDIKKYLLMNDKSPNYYELIGVISHFGESNMGGHFISYCKNSFNGRWYKFNDAMVNESSFQEATSIGLPYVLFYSYIQN